ncbi:SMODS domain-containing nucleotidyltransferase [Actinomycetospora chibensis]|uniref:Cyclic GMP-AMP synthase DncV-like nucleotidyltransferase n=1 Tax=Actinomycetospora chibensis TaxID=663606 RepID=A0ABV9RNN7_9PSEU|nr:hypothetical protein [Actinomycetospora chibensis]MDD7923868.1 hypothetical protein [Actinomycetospora chibensis]
MLLEDRFDAFLEQTVNLRQSRIDQLDGRVTAISNFLQQRSDEFGDRFVELIPQGSYAHGTIINPVGQTDEFDADVLVEVSENASWEAKDYVERLYQSFGTSAVYAPMAHRRSRCVFVDYANEFHLDAVPFLRRLGGNYITNRNKNRYELTNPEGFNEWLDEKDRITGGNLVKVIRLMKYLRDYKNTFTVASVVLTILLAERVSHIALLQDIRSYESVPATLRSIISALDDHLSDHESMPNIADPSCAGETYNHRWDPDLYTNFKAKLGLYRSWIDEAIEEADYDSSVDKWAQLFGDKFRQTSVPVELSNKTAAITAAINEQSIDGTFGIPVRIDPSLDFHITARAIKKSGGLRRYTLSKQGNMALRGMELQFSIRSNVPEPYDVYWKVRNRGDEAQRANQLRGQVVRDEGSRTRKESTAYVGRHFVEAYAVRDGVCVAKDHQQVIVIG